MSGEGKDDRRSHRESREKAHAAEQRGEKRHEKGAGGHQHQGHRDGPVPTDRAPAGQPRNRNDKDRVVLPEATVPVQQQTIIAPLARRKEPQAAAGFAYVVGSCLPLEDRIRSGAVVVGEMAVLKWTGAATFARGQGFLPRDVFVKDRATALHGDVVAVELVPQEQWERKEGVAGSPSDGSPAEKHRPALHRAKDFAEDGSGPTLADGREIRRVLKPAKAVEEKAKSRSQQLSREIGARPPTWSPDLQPVGVVVRVLERRFTRLHPCRCIEAAGEGASVLNIQPNRFYKFRPYDEHFPILAVHGRDIPTNFHEILTKALFLVEVLVDDKGDPDWRGEGRYPVGRVVQSLGLEGTAEAESRAITTLCGIRDFSFPEEVERCVVEGFQIPSVEELRQMGRRDLRGEEFICTIDPATARDLDDALSATQLPGGRWRVGVHIADVSYFVPVGSALDEEARARCTSTYLVERVIPMLPRKLSEDYCSLNAGVDKFAFSVIWVINNEGEIEAGSEWIGQSVIRNSCRMAYEDAQRIIDGDESGDSLVIEPHNGWSREEIVKKVVTSIKNLYKVSSRLRTRRWERGALALNRQKMKLWMENMNSNLAPVGYSLESSIEANWVVEELMLLANCRIAEKIVEFQPDNGLLRRHDPPQKKKLVPLLRIARDFGYVIEAGSSKQLADSIERYKESPDADALRLMLTYCLSLAQYVSSGMDESESVAHYALAVPVYTHFTSPIRRYADLIVHRQLLLSLEIERLVKQLKAEGVSDPVIDPSSDELQHGKFFMSNEEVAVLTEYANDCKTRARNAGTYSIKSFFCFYLRAMEQKAKVDRTLPEVVTSAAICTKVTKKSFVMVSRETAIEVEVYHNSNSQRWVAENTVDDKNGKFSINWGPKPGDPEGTPQIESAGLFFNCVVTIVVVQKARIDLDFILHPPWERESRTGVPTSLSGNRER